MAAKRREEGKDVDFYQSTFNAAETKQKNYVEYPEWAHFTLSESRQKIRHSFVRSLWIRKITENSFIIFFNSPML